jgi:hypothetical protein
MANPGAHVAEDISWTEQRKWFVVGPSLLERGVNLLATAHGTRS